MNSKYFQISLLLILLAIPLKSIGQKNKKGIEIFILDIPNPILSSPRYKACYCCITINESTISEKPIITENEIETFDWNRQIITLNELGKKSISDLDFSKSGVYGMPALLALNKQPIYYFMIFPFGSSVGCDRVYTYIDKNGKIALYFGIGKEENRMQYGFDPRFHKGLELYIKDVYYHN